MKCLNRFNVFLFVFYNHLYLSHDLSLFFCVIECVFLLLATHYWLDRWHGRGLFSYMHLIISTERIHVLFVLLYYTITTPGTA